MADRTSKEIQEIIRNLRMSRTLMEIEISDNKEKLDLKQKKLEKFYKDEWFPIANQYKNSNEIPNELWDRRNSLEQDVEDLKRKIENIQKDINDSSERIELLGEELRQAQEKEREEARKVAETIEEEPTEEILTEAAETIVEEAEEEPNLDQLLAILEGKEAANTLEVPEEAYEEPEGISEEVEKEPEGIPKEIEKEPEGIPKEIEEEPEIISEEVKKEPEKIPENEINQRTVAEREMNPSAIFKRASDETRNSKAISTKKTWTQILMNKIKELAKKGKDAVDNFFNR